MPEVTKAHMISAGELAAWKIADIVGAATDCSAVKIASTITKFFYTNAKAVNGISPEVPPNPLFISNGYYNAHSPFSLTYMKHRTAKTVGSSIVTTAGGFASAATQVNVVGLLKHTSATGSTLAHLKHLHDIGKRYPRSNTVNDWIAICMKMKSMKASIRGTELISAAIPVGALGLATGIATGLARLGISISYASLINRIAMEIHWRAHVEARLTAGRFKQGIGKPNGPATAIYFEIFRRRGLTRAFGQYDVPRFMVESGGWVPLRNKLMML